MRDTANVLLASAFVTALLVAAKINVGPLLNRGWIVPPNLLF